MSQERSQEQYQGRSRLRWKCRRGMKELDLLFLAFLNNGHEDLSEKDKASFLRFLEESDQDLLSYLVQNETPKNESYISVIKAIQASI